MTKQKFSNNETYLPVTNEQWEDLTNEMLAAFNVVASPKFIQGDYMALMLEGVLHGLDRGKGIVSKQDIFERCIHFASMHVSNSIGTAIRLKMKEEAAAKGATVPPEALEALPDEPA
jgi:hypothetical protein